MTPGDPLGGEELLSAMRDLIERLPPDADEIRQRAETLERGLVVFVTSALRGLQVQTAVEEHLRDVAETEHDAAGELRADAQARTAFLIALSHDLRAPIGALVHQAQLLGSDSLTDEIRQRSVETLRENAGLLARMMDDLVDIERFAHGELQLDPRPTRLTTLFDVIGDDSVEVVVEDAGARACVDVEAMTRALRTLVSVKARRYPTSQVIVTGRVVDDEVEVSVRTRSDSAPASEASDASRAIDFRLIGALVEAHHGSMTNVDHGVILRLPLVTDEESSTG